MSSSEVVTITLPTPYAVGPVNCYLLRGDPVTLIDAGPNSSDALTGLRAGFSAAGLQLEDVGQVVLTHQHSDHIGLAHVVQEASGCRVAAHEGVVSFLADWGSSMEGEDAYQAEVMRLHGVPGDVIQTLRVVSRAYHAFGGSVVVDMPLADGDEIVAGGRTLVTRYRPGHSPSDTLFVDQANRVGFAGDHLIGHISSNPIVHRPLGREADPRHRTSSLAAYLDSLARTGDLDLDLLYPGHGTPVPNYRVLVPERIAHYRARSERVLAELAAGARTGYGVARAIWGDVAIRQAYLTLSEVLGALDLLLADSRVVELEADGLLEYEVAA